MPRQLHVFRTRPGFRFTLTLLVLALLFLAVSVQAAPLYSFDPALTTSVQPDGLHLQIELDDTPWGNTGNWTVVPSGIDVYRSELGSAPCSWVKITPTPLPWSWNDASNPHAVLQTVDTTAQPGHGYRYLARSVDAQGQAIAENEDVVLGPATHGVAFLAHAILLAGPGGCGLSYRQEISNSCPEECGAGALLVTTEEPDVIGYFNTGIRMLLYGEITGVSSALCNVNEYSANITAAVPSECVVAVEETAWGNVKRIFR